MRSHRLHRTAIIDAEAQQAEVVAELTILGEHDIADRLTRCQSTRLWRPDGWLWRCRLAGCSACRRTAMRTWWAGIREWAGPQATLVATHLGDDVLGGMRLLRRGLRDVRDRATHRDRRWRAVAFAGMVSDDTAIVFAAHPGIPQETVITVLRPRWPTITIVLPAAGEPSWLMTVETAVRLSVRRRGIEPLRAIIMPQGIACPPTTKSAYLEPMPILL